MSIITLERYELIQFTKVFFCTRSCSSEKSSEIYKQIKYVIVVRTNLCVYRKHVV